MRDGIVVGVLHFSYWATNKTRLDIDKDFDQLLWTYTVGQVKLSHLKKQWNERASLKCYFLENKVKKTSKFQAKWRGGIFQSLSNCFNVFGSFINLALLLWPTIWACVTHTHPLHTPGTSYVAA